MNNPSLITLANLIGQGHLLSGMSNHKLQNIFDKFNYVGPESTHVILQVWAAIRAETEEQPETCIVSGGE